MLSRIFTGGGEKRTITGTSWQIPTPYQDAQMNGGPAGEGNALTLSTFYACVSLLADITATLPLKGYRMKDGGKILVDPQPPLLRESPYPELTWFDWLWMLMESMAVTGNAFGYVTARSGEDARPTAIMPIHPDVVNIVLPEDVGTKWPEPQYYIEGKRIPRDDIVHLKRYPIAGQGWGMSPIQKANPAIQLALAAERYGLRYFRDSANPSGILTTDSDLTPEQTKRAMKQWLTSHQGRRLPAVMSGGIKWQSVTITPEESQFLECVVPGTLFTMADGTRCAAESLRVGDSVMAWNGSKLEAAQVKAVGAPPVKPLVKITTARGRELTATADHPVLGLKALRTPGGRPLSTDGDWLAMGELEPGHYVRVAMGDLPGEQIESLPDDASYFLGAMVGDGSHDKFVPENVFKGGRGAWRAFLGGYFDADGSVRDRDGDQAPAAYWSSTSRELLDGCQHLLALLGINSAIYPMGAGWGLYVMGLSELDKLAREIPVAHTEKRRRLKGYTQAPDSRYRAANFEYDRVATVEYPGPGETVGVEIDELHTHVTAGLITHNTRKFQRSEIAMWFRVPPHMIGDTEKSTSWGTGIEQQTLGFLKFTLMPWLVCIEQAVSALLPRGTFAKFNADELLRGDSKSRWEAHRIARDSGVLSANEIRETEDLQPIEGPEGDIRLQPANFVPLGTKPSELAGNQPNEPSSSPSTGADKES